jgi:hypothetical protein
LKAFSLSPPIFLKGDAIFVGCTNENVGAYRGQKADQEKSDQETRFPKNTHIFS